MQPMNLRAVVAQVARGSNSIRRNFSVVVDSSKETMKEVGGTVFPAAFSRVAPILARRQPMNMGSVLSQVAFGRNLVPLSHGGSIRNISSSNAFIGSKFVRSYSTLSPNNALAILPQKPSAKKTVCAFIKASPFMLLNGLGYLGFCLVNFLLRVLKKVGTEIESKLSKLVASGILGTIVAGVGVNTALGIYVKESLGFMKKLLDKSIDDKTVNLESLRDKVLVMWFLHLLKRKNGASSYAKEIISGPGSMEEIYNVVGGREEMMKAY